jgi:hypothetical protein
VAYGEGGAQNPNYSIAVDSLGIDDQYEPNDSIAQAKTINIGLQYRSLLGKDNDYFRVNTAGLKAIRVRVASYALLGSLYYEVYGSDHNTPVAGGKMYRPNLYEASQVICVQGLSTAYVRVYPAVRAPMVYNLAVENAGACP